MAKRLKHVKIINLYETMSFKSKELFSAEVIEEKWCTKYSIISSNFFKLSSIGFKFSFFATSE